MWRVVLIAMFATLIGCNSLTGPDTSAEQGVAKLVVHVKCACTVQFGSRDPVEVEEGGYAEWSNKQNPRSTWESQRVTVAIRVGGVEKYRLSHFVPWGEVKQLTYDCQ